MSYRHGKPQGVVGTTAMVATAPVRFAGKFLIAVIIAIILIITVIVVVIVVLLRTRARKETNAALETTAEVKGCGCHHHDDHVSA